MGNNDPCLCLWIFIGIRAHVWFIKWVHRIPELCGCSLCQWVKVMWRGTDPAEEVQRFTADPQPVSISGHLFQPIKHICIYLPCQFWDLYCKICSFSVSFTNKFRSVQRVIWSEYFYHLVLSPLCLVVRERLARQWRWGWGTQAFGPCSAQDVAAVLAQSTVVQPSWRGECETIPLHLRKNSIFEGPTSLHSVISCLLTLYDAVCSGLEYYFVKCYEVKSLRYCSELHH